MTLVEVLITLGIFLVVMIAVTAFEANVFIYQGNISSSFTTAQSAQVILRTILTQLRDAAPGANGAFPIINAGSTTLSFFSNADADNQEEEITYTLSSTTLYEAVIQPSGSPAVYNSASQSTTTLMINVRNGGVTPVFQYFDSNYNGTSSPLTQPVTTTSVHLIRVNLTLDSDPNRSPAPVTYTTQVSLRNLKTNL